MEMTTICAVDCTNCPAKDKCGGCVKTGGRPFGGDCVVAMCSKNKGFENCYKCPIKPCELKAQLIKELNALGIEDMDEITDLYSLKGSFVNLEYTLPSGQTVKFLDDNKIYLGTQMSKNGTNRCYGIAADERYIMVCEYAKNGADAQIVMFKKRKTLE